MFDYVQIGIISKSLTCTCYCHYTNSRGYYSPSKSPLCVISSFTVVAPCLPQGQGAGVEVAGDAACLYTA